MPLKMKIYRTWKIIICALLCVFPLDIKGNACQSTHWNGGECKVGCYLTGGWCFVCEPNCVSCSRRYYCDICKTGYYGPTCYHDCVTCRHESCTNNNCTYGCAIGYYLYEEGGYCQRCINTCDTCISNSDCTSCIAGRTGWKCNYACATNCASCNRYNKDACDSCLLGYYGTSCERECNSNCALNYGNLQCSKNNGDCGYGCVDGWTGSQCSEKCDINCKSCDEQDEATCHTCRAGVYGKSCENECSSNCVKSVDIRQCSKNDGQCTDGCVEGWTGSTCTEQCNANCKSCDRWTGTACTSCKPGYYGPSCNIECNEYCGNMSDASRQCQQDDGTCLDNCVTGYKGDTCDVPCDASCRRGCARKTGVCQPCEPAYFGPSCQHLCKSTCFDPVNGSNICDHHSGECLFHCSQLLCSSDGQTIANQDNGAVTGGAVVVIVLIIVAILVIFFIKRRRRNIGDPERSVTYENSQIDNDYEVPTTSNYYNI